MKNILAIMGSPRKNKNTDYLLSQLVSEIDKKNQIKKINLVDLEISPCRACDYCGKTGECIIDDDMQEIYKLIDEADILVLASPVYFNSVNSMTKAFIDRCQKYWSIKYKLEENYRRGQNRKGIFISVGGASYSHDQFVVLQPLLDYFFKAVNMKHVGNYFVANTDKVDVSKREKVIEDMKYIGQNIENIKDFTIQL